MMGFIKSHKLTNDNCTYIKLSVITGLAVLPVIFHLQDTIAMILNILHMTFKVREAFSHYFEHLVNVFPGLYSLRRMGLLAVLPHKSKCVVSV